jgi:hypothetical protein
MPNIGMSSVLGIAALTPTYKSGVIASQMIETMSA